MSTESRDGHNQTIRPESTMQMDGCSDDFNCKCKLWKRDKHGECTVGECAECLEAMRVPTTLHCGHTLCIACVDRLTNETHEIQCPLCYHTTNIPDGGLKKNVLVEQMLKQYYAEQKRIQSTLKRLVSHDKIYSHVESFVEVYWNVTNARLNTTNCCSLRARGVDQPKVRHWLYAARAWATSTT